MRRQHISYFRQQSHVNKDHAKAPGIPFRNTAQLAAELIEGLTPPQGVKVIVLFERYYLCKTLDRRRPR